MQPDKVEVWPGWPASDPELVALIESLQDGYYEVDLQGNFRVVNDRLCAIMGHPREVVLGTQTRRFENYTDEQNADAARRAFRYVLRTGQAMTSFEGWLFHADGTPRYVEMSIALMRDARGEPVGFRGIVRDTTERRALQDAIHRLTQARLSELRTLEQLKSDMIRAVAHDIRSPLGVISGYLDLLSEDFNPRMTDDHRKYFAAIRRSIQRMQRMSSDLLALERVQFSQQMQRQRFSLHDVAARAAGEAYDGLVQKGLTLTTHLCPVPVEILGSPDDLYEAITNLLGNAIKYTPEGGTIMLRLQTAQAVAVVEVEDSGVGVPVEQQARLFEPFFRAKTSETARIEGTGLGLYLVKQIAERHGGKVRFRSEYRRGSTFGFELPVAPQDEANGAAAR